MCTFSSLKKKKILSNNIKILAIFLYSSNAILSRKFHCTYCKKQSVTLGSSQGETRITSQCKNIACATSVSNPGKRYYIYDKTKFVFLTYCKIPACVLLRRSEYWSATPWIYGFKHTYKQSHYKHQRIFSYTIYDQINQSIKKNPLTQMK